MKAFNQLTLLFVILTSSALLSGCGGAGKSNASLEVSTGALTASNSSYEGGLVIMGRSGNQNFVIPISQSGSSGNKVTIELPRGTWNFSTVAWDGVPTPFTGTVLCDDVTVTLDQSEQTVNLTPTTAKCFDSRFGAAVYNNGSNFNMARIVTCGWLYEDAGATIPVRGTTTANFCSSLPAERQQYASSVKLEVPSISNGTVSAGISKCFATGSSGVFNLSTTQLPSAKLPTRIKLYKNTTCDETDPEQVKGSYFFPDGVANAVADQDSFINANSSTLNVFLPFNKIKRGYSPFISLLPAIKCNGVSCTSLPTTTPSGEDRVMSDFREIVLIENPTGNQKCSNMASITSGVFTVTFNPSSDCREENGRIIGRIGLTPATTGTITINWIDATAVVSKTVFVNDSYRMYEQLFSGVGYPAGSSPITAIQYSFERFYEDDDKKEYGILSDVRDVFEVDGPAGLLGSVSCALGFRKEKMISMYDKGVWKTYNVVFTDSDQAVSSIEADGTRPSGTPYDKKIILQEKDSSGVFNTKATVDFFCAYKMGVYESHDTKNGKVDQKKIYWNTQSATNGNVESYSSWSESVFGVIQSYTSEVFRIKNPTDSNKAIVGSFRLNLKKNGAVYESNSVKAQSDIYAGNYIRYIEGAYQQNLASLTDTSFVTGISSAVSGVDICMNHSTPVFTQDSPGVCSAYLSTFNSSVTWGNLLPAGFSSNFTPNSTFTAQD